MTEIVGIQFKNASRVYYFAPLEYKFNVNDFAVVETVRGLELGKVAIANRLVEDSEVAYELKPVIRIATKHDLEQQKKHDELAPKSFEIFKKYVKQLQLPMKPLECEYTIDHSKILFYYTADDRVDFRELLKLLTPEFHLRIELRQIGPREAARIVGGLGPCGRVVCCKSCLSNFDFVTMKMAKDQGMSLNTSKISGSCGKLMCCIGYEQEMYAELKKELPQVGSLVKTPKCNCAKVLSVDYMKKIVRAAEGDNVINSYPVQDLKVVTVQNPSVENVEDIVVVEVTDEKVAEVTKKDNQNRQNNQQNKPKPQQKNNNQKQNNQPKQQIKNKEEKSNTQKEVSDKAEAPKQKNNKPKSFKKNKIVYKKKKPEKQLVTNE